jgi:hypothetical protein
MDDLSGGAGAGGWVQQGTVWHGQPVVGASFDPVEERLWVTDSDGFLASYTLPDQSIYSSTRAVWVANYDDAAWSISNLQGHGLRPTAAARCVSPPGSEGPLKIFCRPLARVAHVIRARAPPAHPGPSVSFLLSFPQRRRAPLRHLAPPV